MDRNSIFSQQGFYHGKHPKGLEYVNPSLVAGSARIGRGGGIDNPGTIIGPEAVSLDPTNSHHLGHYPLGSIAGSGIIITTSSFSQEYFEP
ncbi:hypothetical protein [Candidatus Methylacidiphilum infernorum]|uniref:Uncharacterized protein n=1 Tax=Methylacidiphilum infernorum (isolate V4) TaxID=481448 RepID=B3DZ33_METI4|nr:hypothetical protein [Candidatus Methylacidiphilum infernorum]ACD84125.1 Hypothetical protein Minf_2071 [Methylacidiphilum infernorum V4]